MAFVKVEVSQTRFERRIYYSPGPVNTVVKANESRFFIWHDNKEGTGKALTHIPLHEIGEYHVHIYFSDGKALPVAGRFHMVAPGASARGVTVLGEKSIVKQLFHVVHLGCYNPADVSLAMVAGRENISFSCNRIVMILEQIV